MPNKVNSKKREARWEYMFCYIDRCNKFENALTDCKYQINSREMFHQAMNDLRHFTNDNIRAIVSYQMLRKKYVTVAEQESK